ncbi:MAG: peptide deformylase [Chloroflexota bacterium]|nr:peptide deformylase [Chloroflexota bacterium]
MGVREISLIGDEILRKKARKVKKFDRKLHQLIDDMVETMRDAPGIGLAAPQVGVSQRVIVVEFPEDEEDLESNRLYEVVNPQIVFASEDIVEGEEGCLSIPDILGEVWRAQMVVLKGQDRNGKTQRLEAHDWLARVFQHEVDHLDGVLFIDHAEGPHKLRRLVLVEDEDGVERLTAVPF